MAPPGICPQCGDRLPADMPHGVCPKCMLGLGFDDPPSSFSAIEIDTPDAAIGRIPATNASEARRIVERIIAYEEQPAPGTWRNHVLLAADDEDAIEQARESGLLGPVRLVPAQISTVPLP